VKYIEKILSITLALSVLLANVGFAAQFEYCGVDESIEISINPNNFADNGNNCCLCECNEEDHHCSICYKSIEYYSADLELIISQIYLDKLFDIQNIPLYLLEKAIENTDTTISSPEFFVDLPPPVSFIISYMNNFKSAIDSDPVFYSI